MSSLPAEYRGVGSGMNTTFQNSAQVLSIGIFFSLIILGPLRVTAPEPLPRAGGARRANATAHQVSQLPPVSTLFAALLGYNPIQHLVGPRVLSSSPSPSRRP